MHITPIICAYCTYLATIELDLLANHHLAVKHVSRVACQLPGIPLQLVSP
jgi:hypothetical protein